MEIWKTVPEYEGAYEASDRGQVRSLDRTIMVTRLGVTAPRRLSGKIINPHMRPDGYPQLILYTPDGTPKTCLVHTLVLGAFAGGRPDGQEGLHDDNDPSNSHLSNIRWGTPKENAADRARHGTQVRGERQGRAKLTADDVRKIRRLRGTVTQLELSRRFGVSPGGIQAVMDGKSWKHVGDIS